MTSALVYVYGSTPMINLATPYRFEFVLNGNVAAGNSVRITYPPGYSSQKVTCSVDGLSGSAVETSVLHNNRTFVCKNLNKVLSKEAIVITQVTSPPFSGTQRGFLIEVLQGNSPIVLQRISFNGDIYISPGTPSFTVTPNALFKSAYVTYTFKVLLANRVSSNGAIFLNFTSDWVLYSPTCKIKQGGVPLQTS